MASSELHLSIDVDTGDPPLDERIARVRDAVGELEAALNALDGASVTVAPEPIADESESGGEG